MRIFYIFILCVGLACADDEWLRSKYSRDSIATRELHSALYEADDPFASKYNRASLGIGFQGGFNGGNHSPDVPLNLVVITARFDYWNKWLYWGVDAYMGGKGIVDIFLIAFLDTVHKGSGTSFVDEMSVRVKLGMPLFFDTQYELEYNPLFLYLVLATGGYHYDKSAPFQAYTNLGLGVMKTFDIGDLWQLECALEYGYMPLNEYATSQGKIKAGYNSHEIRAALGFVNREKGWRKSTGYYVRLSGIYRLLDSIPALPNALPAYPRSTQAIGMLEVGFAL